MADSKFKTNLTVSASPHLVTTLDTKKTMQYVVLALLPATVMATVYFGIGALLRVILGALFCFVSEYLYNRLMISVLIHTDLPEPVAPAISRWGILLMSPMMT